MKELKHELVNNVSSLAGNVYNDVVKPVVKPIGEILGFLPRTVRLMLQGWEKWLINGEESLRLTSSAIEKKVKDLPPDKIVEPEPYVAIPAIQQISYCQNNDDLRNLYANLLVSSMNIDTKWAVHPAFVDIIKQLSPDEARIINEVRNVKCGFMPLLDVKGQGKGSVSGGHQLIVTNFTNVGLDKIELKENICNYVDNLVRLNLFEIPPGYALTDKSLYDGLKHNPVLERMLDPYRVIYDIDYNLKAFIISNFGLSFKRVCCTT